MPAVPHRRRGVPFAAPRAAQDLAAGPLLALERSLTSHSLTGGADAASSYNFPAVHQPGSSHLELLQAVAGADLVERAHQAAVRASYLWHEFGDSCLLLP